MRGSVRKRVNKRSISWIVRVEYPPDPATGERIQRSETFPSKDAADDRLAKWLAELSGTAPIDARKVKVGAYLLEWLETTAKQAVRATTYRAYEQSIRNHLIPQLGNHLLGKLQPIHVKRALVAIRASGRQRGVGDLSARTVRNARQVLHKALDDAVAWGMISSNVARLAKAGKIEKADIKVWDSAELGRFLAVAEPLTAEPWGPLWRLAIATGMRQGELLGLPWRNVDFDRGRIHVRRLLVPGKGSTPIFGEPKTEQGRRVIPIDAVTVAALRAHRHRQKVARIGFGPAWRDYDLVFTVAGGGPLDGTNVTRRFVQLTSLVEDLEIIRFHDLRHSHATLLLREGVPVKIVSERLGHAGSAITLDIYAHVLPDMQQAAVEAVERALFPPLVKAP